jgi:hypothetical protein
VKTKPIIAGAVLIANVAILLSLTIVFITARPSPPAVTVRYAKSIRTGDWVAATFEIINHTATGYYVFTVFLEVHDGPMWRTNFNLRPLRPAFLLGPHGVATHTVVGTNLPAGYPLRLRMVANRGLTGLSGFFRRLRLWLQGSQVSLNPFDKKPVGSNRTQILSEEFIEPEPK